jgi:hypothetical protein
MDLSTRAPSSNVVRKPSVLRHLAIQLSDARSPRARQTSPNDICRLNSEQRRGAKLTVAALSRLLRSLSPGAERKAILWARQRLRCHVCPAHRSGAGPGPCLGERGRMQRMFVSRFMLAAAQSLVQETTPLMPLRAWLQFCLSGCHRSLVMPDGL